MDAPYEVIQNGLFLSSLLTWNDRIPQYFHPCLLASFPHVRTFCRKANIVSSQFSVTLRPEKTTRRVKVAFLTPKPKSLSFPKSPSLSSCKSPHPNHLELLARQLCHSHHELGGSHLPQGFWNRTKMAAWPGTFSNQFWKKLQTIHLRIFIPWWTTESYGEVLFRPTIWVLWTTPQRCCQTDLAVRGILMKHGHGTSDVQNDHEANSISMIASNQHLHIFTCSEMFRNMWSNMWYYICITCIVNRWEGGSSYFGGHDDKTRCTFPFLLWSTLCASTPKRQTVLLAGSCQ